MKKIKNHSDIRVVLIAPRAVAAKKMIRRVQPPLGLYCIGAGLRQDGFKSVLIYDCLIEDYNDVRPLQNNKDMITYGSSDEKVMEMLKKFKPDVVGVSSLFSSQVSQSYAIVSNIL